MRPKSTSQPNIILISLDCVRQDRLSCYGNHDIRTPNIDAIATEGVRFTQAICQAPFTTPSLASMLTGLYPFNHNIRLLVGQYLEQNIPTFGNLFKQVGYVTGGFPSVFLLDRNSGFKNGFDVFDDKIETIRYGFRGPWRPGDLTTDALLRFIETYKRKPFAAWVHYFDPHDYNPGNPDSVLMQNRKIEETDGFIAKLINSLKKWRIWEKTLVVVTADHGDSFGEHGEYGHGKALYDTTLRVPLVFRWPQQLPKGRFIEQQVRLIDILPTILDLIGCLETVHSKNIFFDGVSLLPTIEGKDLNLPAYSETSPVQLFTGDLLATKDFENVEIMSLRQNGKKYIFKNRIYELLVKPRINIGRKVGRFLKITVGKRIPFFLNRFFSPESPSKEKEELYDLIKDSEEKRNLASKYRDICIQMKSDLNALVLTKTTIRRGELIGSTKDEITTIRKQLKNLGYL